LSFNFAEELFAVVNTEFNLARDPQNGSWDLPKPSDLIKNQGDIETIHAIQTCFE
jgi:hypothetical protein